MKIGEETTFIQTVRRGKTATITMHTGTVVALRTVKQALVRPENGRTTWVDQEVLSELVGEPLIPAARAFSPALRSLGEGGCSPARSGTPTSPKE